MNKRLHVAFVTLALASCYATDVCAQPEMPDSVSSTVARTGLKGPGSFQRITVAAVADKTISAPKGSSDQTREIQSTLDALRPGQRLVIQPGTYVVSHSLVVRTQAAVVTGYGASFIATNPDDQALVVMGTGATIAGLTLRGTGHKRLETESSAKIVVRGKDIQILDTTIEGGASAGIFVSHASRIVIARNKVQKTLADGIHVTGASRDVLVSNNTVIGTGDDLIAIVSYKKDGALSRNVLVTHNTVSGNYWGRGLSVVGGADVTLSENDVRGVQKAAGIMVAHEDGYRTYNVRNVVIAHNVVSDIEDPVYRGNGLPPAEQAGIDINTGDEDVALVAVKDNQVSRASYDGFRALGNVCQFDVANTAFSSITGSAISLQTNHCTPSAMTCRANTLDGKLLPQAAGCTGSGKLVVTGADVSRLPAVDLRALSAHTPDLDPADANGRAIAQSSAKQ
ncbi:right-handed parallel beta-helix repeat-containing protein [Paraburkholderia sp. MPAMCS5]|uniref:right-handed parallel beta-helix repeat-containing protein n=1 Tax=Paraburkholderia sp. MPAMCS5 TaxID=3112563 RepID=UPI002E18AD5C|nr:right-handed parallel beta-helix repeat-containing protein [Paraburkholderia sp. MPAMCS5]